mgnify:CR=1 FL=1
MESKVLFSSINGVDGGFNWGITVKISWGSRDDQNLVASFVGFRKSHLEARAAQEAALNALVDNYIQFA